MTYLPASTSWLGCRKDRIQAPASPECWAKYPSVVDCCPDTLWVPRKKKKTQNKSPTGRLAMLRTWAVAIIRRLHSVRQRITTALPTRTWIFCALLTHRLPIVSIDICFWLYTSPLSGRTLGGLVEPISFLLPVSRIIPVHLLCAISEKGLNGFGGKSVTKAHSFCFGDLFYKRLFDLAWKIISIVLKFTEIMNSCSFLATYFKMALSRLL